MSGANGPRFLRQEVEDLLAKGQQARRLCKGWMSTHAAAQHKQSLRHQQDHLDDAIAAQPGSDSLGTIDNDFAPIGAQSARAAGAAAARASTSAHAACAMKPRTAGKQTSAEGCPYLVPQKVAGHNAACLVLPFGFVGRPAACGWILARCAACLNPHS